MQFVSILLYFSYMYSPYSGLVNFRLTVSPNLYKPFSDIWESDEQIKRWLSFTALGGSGEYTPSPVLLVRSLEFV